MLNCSMIGKISISEWIFLLVDMNVAFINA